MIAMTMLCHAASAQQRDREIKSLGYVFFAPGWLSFAGQNEMMLHFGAGAEGMIYGGFGIGAEAGYLVPITSAVGGLGIVSVNGHYKFRDAGLSKKVIPFISGGYSLGFTGDLARGGGTFGGGMDIWFKNVPQTLKIYGIKKTGLRTEFRGYISAAGKDTNVWEVRVALLF
jgi:hypothetical protein